MQQDITNWITWLANQDRTARNDQLRNHLHFIDITGALDRCDKN